MTTHYRTVRISILVLLIVFMSLGLTTNNAVKNEKEYTEVLHFQYGYLPDGTPSHDNERGEQPKWVEDELPYELNPELAGRTVSQWLCSFRSSKTRFRRIGFTLFKRTCQNKDNDYLYAQI